MRASRLLSLLLLLQTRGRMTARDLAGELEVSMRTIYRDVESLGAAGVPVYADTGPAGGYRLLDGYRTRLTGLTPDEAQTLFLAGMPGAAAELGLGSVLAAAELKLLASFPAEWGASAGRVRERFHLDAPGWFRAAEETPHLGALADAVWRERVVRLRYRRWKAPTEVTRVVCPLGVVLKAGRWYLIATPDPDDGVPRAYRVGNVLDLVEEDRGFSRPAGFDLAGFWEQWARRYEDWIYHLEADILVSPAVFAELPGNLPVAMSRAARAAAAPPDEDGWIRTTVPIESIGHGHRELLRFGAGLRVLGPPELRERFVASARELSLLYPSHQEESDDDARGPVGLQPPADRGVPRQRRGRTGPAVAAAHHHRGPDRPAAHLADDVRPGR